MVDSSKLLTLVRFSVGMYRLRMPFSKTPITAEEERFCSACISSSFDSTKNRESTTIRTTEDEVIANVRRALGTENAGCMGLSRVFITRSGSLGCENDQLLGAILMARFFLCMSTSYDKNACLRFGVLIPL
jgi:hypothetical protein